MACAGSCDSLTFEHHERGRGIKMVIYQVHGTERQKIDASLLKAMKDEQIKCIKGVYGWYILSDDLKKLDAEYGALDKSKRIYLYIGTVTGTHMSSVTSRFLGELYGVQISADKGSKFDTDFAVSLVIAFLCEKEINVYFDVLSDTHGIEEEVRIAQREDPILQAVSAMRVKLRPDIKRAIVEKTLAEEIATVGTVVLGRLGARFPKNPVNSPRPEHVSQAVGGIH